MGYKHHQYRLWQPATQPTEATDEIIDNNIVKRHEGTHSAIHNDRFLEEESEFHRIRNMRRLEEILTCHRRPHRLPPSQSKAGVSNDEGEIFSNNEDEISVNMSPLTVTIPPPRPFVEIINSSLVVGQEVALTVILLAIHREIVVFEESEKIHEKGSQLQQKVQHPGVDSLSQKSSLAIVVLYSTLLIIVYFNQRSSSMLVDEDISCDNKGLLETKNGNDSDGKASMSANSDDGSNTVRNRPKDHQKGHKRKRAFVRLSDGLIIAAMLRFISSVLRTLTASYSTDTVYALAISGMAIHLIACDYKYANGWMAPVDDGKLVPWQASQANPRPAFLGGTISLNAAFFSTALLVSRIKSNLTSYAFVSSVVTLFAFYPESRHRISRIYPNSLCGSPCFVITTALSISAWLLISPIERFLFSFLQSTVMILSPLIEWQLQSHKQVISGPWDIAHFRTAAN